MSNLLRKHFDMNFDVSDPPEPVGRTSSDLKPPSTTQRQLPALFGLALTATAAVSVVVFGVVLLVLTGLFGFLRQRKNKIFWEVGCWTIVTFGIIARQTFQPTQTLDLSGIAPSVALASCIVALAVMPGLMRWINKITVRPSLLSVAVPFSLGFFLDYAQVLASKYVVHLPWVPASLFG